MKPITLSEAAHNLNLRHLQVTGEDQHISVKTLNDYYDKIKTGKDSEYNFKANKDELVKELRDHCSNVRAVSKQGDEKDVSKTSDNTRT